MMQSSSWVATAATETLFRLFMKKCTTRSFCYSHFVALVLLVHAWQFQGVFNLDKDEALPKIDIKFAIIPCGSGNGVVHYLTRSFTMEHAVAALILGKTTALPVVAVRNLDDVNSLVGLAIVCVNYGITSDAIVVAG